MISNTPDSKDSVLLSVRQVDRVYRMGEVDVAALRDASIDIREGEFLVILGPSGSGKSTLLNLIGGMDRPTAGQVLFDGEDISQASDRRLTRYRRQQIGFVFQFFNLVPSLTALENVQVTVEVARDPKNPNEMLRLVGLQDRADHFPSQLSGGQQQRVAIARALAGNPRLLLCDEPTGALDLETARQILGILDELNRDLGKTVILTTHNNALAGLAERVAVIRDGRVAEIRTNNERMPAAEVAW